MRVIIIALCLILASCVSSSAKIKHRANGIVMTVSWYQSGHRTANGQRFNPDGNTVAHRHWPFGTKLRITNPSNNKSVIAVVTDRGPFIKGVGLDVSRGIAKRLGFISKGKTKLLVEIIK